jgi:hypothetical protein
MSAPFDPTRRVEIGMSGQLLRLAALSMLLTGISAVIGLRMIGNMPAGGFGQLAGLAGMFVFGICSFVLFRHFAAGGSVVTLAPEGIRDTRIATAFVPWTAIRKISTWERSGQRVMVLEIDPIAETQLPTTRAVTWLRLAKARPGADGLWVRAQGLDISHDELLAMTMHYAEAARPV